jgi:hypothetical protein
MMIATAATLKILKKNSASLLGTGAGGDCQAAGAGNCGISSLID